MTNIKLPCSSFIPQPELCLNQGYCLPNTTTTTCVCPPGFASDDLLFHLGNCLTVWLFLFREWMHTMNLASRIGKCTLGLVFFVWLTTMTMYAQNGYYEAATVLMFVSELFMIQLVYYLFLAFIIPLCTIFRISSKRIKKALFGGAIMVAGVAFILAAVMLAFSRQPDEFNRAQFAHGLFFFVLDAASVSVLVWQSWNLAKLLSGLHRSPDMPARRLREIKTLERRTKFMTLSLVLHLLLGLSVLVALLTIQLYGFYLCAFVLVHFALLLAVGVVLFLQQRHNRNDRSTIGYVVEKNKNEHAVEMDVSWTKTKQLREQQVFESGKHRAFRSEGDEYESNYVPSQLVAAVTVAGEFSTNKLRIGEIEDFQLRNSRKPPQSSPIVVSIIDDYRRRAGDVVVSSSAAPVVSRNSEMSHYYPSEVGPSGAGGRRWPRRSLLSEVEGSQTPPSLPSLPSTVSLVGKTSRTSARYQHRPSLISRGDVVSSMYESEVHEVDITNLATAPRPFSRYLNLPPRRHTKNLGLSKFEHSEAEPNF
ncbi:hypothetical protein BASA81_000630 [Batrachochytrium salamandrivorans]|nr:hypothetical protein BASA81_000630 [Batrachochytrium salamandrivorans]